MRFEFAENAFLKCIDDAVDSIKAASELPDKEFSSILRGGLMLVVSSFDFFVHEVVRVEIQERVKSASSNLFINLPYSCLDKERGVVPKEVDFYVRKASSHKAFVSSSSVKECFNHFGINIWKEMESSLGREAKNSKKKLDDIWRWRNRVAHEGDMVPSNTTFSYWPIFEEDVIEASSFLKLLARDVLKVMRSLL